MKTAIQFCALLLLSVYLFSCFGGTEAGIDPELREYVDRFNEEAKARNLDFEIRIAEIDVNLAEIFSNGVLGQCLNTEEGVDAVQIDRSYWESPTTTDLDKEFVIFHELGHCVLERSHINTPDGSGTCTSIMYDGNSSSCMLDYNSDNREEMIDELFQ